MSMFVLKEHIKSLPIGVNTAEIFIKLHLADISGNFLLTIKRWLWLGGLMLILQIPQFIV